MRELQLTARGLVRSPTFTLPALVVLALGIGGTTGVFSVINSVLLRPLAFPDAHELVRIWSRNDERRIEFLSVSPADLQDWRRRAPRAGRLAAYERPEPLLLRDGGTAQVLALRAEGELFDLLGTPAALGRTLAPGDANSTHAVISHGLWTSRFGGSATALGQPLVTDDGVWTIVGVMPRGFDLPNAAADVWLPLRLDPTVSGQFAHTLRVLLRTPDGATPEDVRRGVAVVAAQLADERPGQNRGWSVTVRPLFDTVVSPEFARSLWLVMGAVLFTLLMASTTVAGLLLARASARDREFAIRLALGATRGELVRILLGECLVLAAAAGALGVLLALWGVDAVKAFGPTSVPRIDEVAIDGRVTLVAAFVTVVTAFVAVIAPAWQATRQMHDRLRVRDGLTDAATSRLRDVLVGLQVATAVLLLVGAALLAQTAVNLRGRELGFDVDRLVTAQVVLPVLQTAGPDGAARMEMQRDRVARLPGVSRVAVASGLPFSGQNSGNTFVMDDRQADQPPDTDYRVVGAGYFETMGIPLRAGRGIAGADGPGNPIVVISETAARRFWPDRDPLGRRVRLGNSGWMTIVGVAGDARYGALDDPGNDVRPMMYVPHRQMPAVPAALVVRAGVAPDSLVGVVRDALLEGGSIGVSAVETMASTIRATTGPQRFTATLATVFATVVTVLASLALYGLLAFVVGRRTREIGLRLALGATRRDVAAIVASRAGVPVVGGVVAGLLASAAVSGALQRVLFGVAGIDVTTYAAVALGVVMLAVAASCVPARRAMHVDPMHALRAE